MSRRMAIRIRVALDSILYAPLYAFVQENSLRKSAFLFYIEPVHDPIQPSDRSKLHSLGPISFDPVFSPVCDKNRFADPKYRNTWFGVGDPLRAHRLAQDLKSEVSCDFLGTLVSKLAFWIITEQKCKLIPDRIKDFNYVACHSKGMTGYYVSETLFKSSGNNPLAPVKKPGQEAQHIFDLLQVDWRRRSDDDPVWIAAVSTEIGKMMYLKRKYERKGRMVNVRLLYKTIGSGLLPSDFVMTAVVGRRDPKNKLIDEAGKYLKEGLINSIGDLRAGNTNFCKNLADFHGSQGLFSLPGKNHPFSLRKEIDEIVEELQKRDLYPTNELFAPVSAKSGTDQLLKAAIKHDLVSGGGESEINEQFDKLQTNVWGADPLWK